MANPAVTFHESGVITFVGAVYTKTAAGIGVANANRRVVVTLGGIGFRTLSSLTIGGVAATIHYQLTTANSAFVACASAVVPTGTTGDIVATMSGTPSTNLIYATYSLDDSTAGTPTTDTSTGVGVSTIDTTFAQTQNGCMIGVTAWGGGQTKTPITVPGYVEDAETNTCLNFHLNAIASTGTGTATTNWTGLFNAGSGAVAWPPIIRTTTGALVGAGAAVAGAATRNTTAAHTSTGALAGAGAAVAGSASRNTASVTITGISVSTDGVNLIVAYTTSVNLTAGVAGFGYSIGAGEPITWWQDVAGAASSQYISVPLATLGISPGDIVNVDAGYSLTNPAGTILYATDEGTAITSINIGIATHTSTGDLSGAGAAIAGAATRNASTADTATGALVGAGATIAGEAAFIRTHTSSGALAGAGASTFGASTSPPDIGVAGGSLISTLISPLQSITSVDTRLE
jgi:hypothetical protein